jgi:hypothetical protein
MSKLRFLITFALLEALTPLAARADSTPLPPVCKVGANLYSYPASVARACGDSVFPLDHVQTRADGGHDYIYFVNRNMVVIPMPPANFNPSTATPAQLSYYGYPPRPTNPTQLPAWQAEVTKMQVTSSLPFLIETPLTAPGAIRITVDAASQSLNWGGYVDTGNTFTEAYIDYYEAGQAATSCTGDQVVLWTGIGGYNYVKNGTLGQDGTAPWTNGFMPVHEAWFEIVPDEGIMDMGFAASAYGDDIQAHTYWLSSSHQFKFTVWDTTTGKQKTVYQIPNSGDTVDLSSSEFIVERPTYNGTIVPLRNFWTRWDVNAAQSNNIGMQNFTLTKINMFNNSGKQLETTSSNNGQSFSATWEACG